MILYKTSKKLISIVVISHHPKHSSVAEETRNNKSTNRKKLIGVFFLFVTLGFVFATTPSAVIGAFFIQDLYKEKTGKLIVWIFDALLFTFHSTKFEIILIFNYLFKNEFKCFCLDIMKKGKNLRRNFTTVGTKSVVTAEFSTT